MKNLLNYEEFLNESIPLYSFDGCELNVGSRVISFDGYSGIIVSKENSNGTVKYRDSKGNIHICESFELILDPINEDLQWWEIAKGILAADSIKVGASLAGGGLIIASHLFSHWRNSISDKLQKLKSDTSYKNLREIANKIADKFNSDAELNKLLSELQKYPYQDPLFVKGNRAISKVKETNNFRTKIMKEIANYIKSKLDLEEAKYFQEINKILKDKPLTDISGNKIEEDAMTDPNRTVGTGTYTSTHSDPNVLTKGYSNSTDSASGGSHPVYIS